MLCLDNAFGVKPPANGRIVRNLIQGINFVMSHILHFYHLAALDYVKGPETPPFIPRYEYDGVYRLPKAANDKAVEHYVQALDIRKKCHECLAVFGAKAPHTTVFTPGGVTELVTPEKIAQYKSYLDEIISFVDDVYIPDVLAVADFYSEYFEIGVGCKNMLAYGVFPLTDEDDPDGQNQLIKRGRYTKGKFGSVDPQKITEDVKFSWFDNKGTHRHPSEGMTIPLPRKTGAYSWLKAPRYDNQAHEVGPLARMWVNQVQAVADLGQKAFSVLGRHYARAVECSMIAHELPKWLEQLVPGEPTFAPYDIPKEGQGMGLTEAPRGALGHWIDIKGYVINNYQAVVPTTWNCSPRDDNGIRGAVEEALVGTPVKDPKQPIELVRVVRSFDPCIACAVHVLDIKGGSKRIHQFRV